jgi:hypothetical protein
MKSDKIATRSFDAVKKNYGGPDNAVWRLALTLLLLAALVAAPTFGQSDLGGSSCLQLSSSTPCNWIAAFGKTFDLPSDEVTAIDSDSAKLRLGNLVKLKASSLSGFHSGHPLEEQGTHTFSRISLPTLRNRWGFGLNRHQWMSLESVRPFRHGLSDPSELQGANGVVDKLEIVGISLTGSLRLTDRMSAGMALVLLGGTPASKEELFGVSASGGRSPWAITGGIRVRLGK